MRAYTHNEAHLILTHTHTYIHTYTYTQTIQAACMCHTGQANEAVTEIREFLTATQGWYRPGYEDLCEAYVRVYIIAAVANKKPVSEIHKTLGGKTQGLDDFLKGVLQRKPGHVGTISLVADLMMEHGMYVCVYVCMSGSGSDDGAWYVCMCVCVYVW